MSNDLFVLLVLALCASVAYFMIGFIYALNFEQKIADENVKHYNFMFMCATWLLYDMAVNHFEVPNY